MHKAIGRILAALGVLALAVGIAQSSLVQPKSTGSLPHRSPNSETQALRDPRFKSTCVNVSAFPSGKTGDFCVQLLKAGVWTEIIQPPHFTDVDIYPFGKANIKFFDYERNRKDNKLVLREVGVIQHSGDPGDTTCHPKSYVAFSIKMEENDKGARVRFGGERSPQYAHCR